MNSSVTKGFRKQLTALPTEVQDQANRAYALWRSDPYRPSLQFKQVNRREPIYSVRVGIGYRAEGPRGLEDLGGLVSAPARPPA